MSLNCWELKKCGRQPGGVRVADIRVCRAAIESRADGLNGGRKGGRICWASAGTMCGGKLQGTFAKKLPTCMACEFYRLVYAEQGNEMVSVAALEVRLYQH